MKKLRWIKKYCIPSICLFSIGVLLLFLGYYHYTYIHADDADVFLGDVAIAIILVSPAVVALNLAIK